MKQGIVLFAHGARDPEWARPLARLAQALQQRAPHCLVRQAFLEFMAPDLTQAIAELVQAGVGRLQVVPVFLAQGGHVKRDLPAMLEAARTAHPGLVIELLPALGEAQPVIEAMADWVAAQHG